MVTLNNNGMINKSKNIIYALFILVSNPDKPEPRRFLEFRAEFINIEQ